MIDNERMKVLSNIEHIGTLPRISLQLFKLARNPTSSINEICNLILQDPTITAQLLKIANTAYYCRTNRVKNVSDALITLGLDEVKRLVMAVEMIGLFKNNRDFFYFNETTFYKECFARALLSNNIALEMNIEDSESTFVCALLQDIGILAIRQYLPDMFGKICALMELNNYSATQACSSVGCMDYNEITFQLFVQWKMPEHLINTFTKKSMESDIVKYADHLLHKYDGYLTWNKYDSKINSFSTETIAVDEDKLIKMTKDAIETAHHTFPNVCD